MGHDTAAVVNRLQSSVVKAFTGYYRLRDFVQRIRGCKTQSEERTLVAKEAASIRAAFKSESSSLEQRYHNIAKLLYIHLLGYPTLFGQVECMKLAASTRLRDKRMGYLGTAMEMDEEQSTLMLVTNSLKSDLVSRDELRVGLALGTLATIASVDVARDLADEVERLLQVQSTNVRKKVRRGSSCVSVFVGGGVCSESCRACARARRAL